MTGALAAAETDLRLLTQAAIEKLPFSASSAQLSIERPMCRFPTGGFRDG